RSRTAIPADLFAELLTMLTADHALVDQGGEIAAANHHPALTSEQETAISAFVAELEGQPFNPPPLSDLVRRYRLTPALLQYLVVDGLAVMVVLAACGPQPPDASSLLNQSSQHMLNLKGFHFQMQISGFTGSGEPVQNAQGDAHPPDLHARVNLKEGAILLEVEVVFAGAQVFLKSF